MRLALLALLLLLAPAAVSAGPLDGSPERVLASRAFVASPRATFSLEVPEAATVSFSVSIRDGLFEGLRLTGPAGCTANDPIEGRGRVFVSCGSVEAGTYQVVVEVGGTATGNIRAQGGYFVPATPRQP